MKERCMIGLLLWLAACSPIDRAVEQATDPLGPDDCFARPDSSGQLDIEQSIEAYSACIERHAFSDQEHARTFNSRRTLDVRDGAATRAPVGIDQQGSPSTTDPDLLFYMGKRHFVLGRYETAIARIGRGLQYRPRNVEALHLRGASRFRVGRISGAIVDFSQALRFDSNHVGSLYLRGLSYLEIGETGKAAADFKRLQRLNPVDGLTTISLAN